MVNLPIEFAERMKRLLGEEYEAFLQSYDSTPSRALTVNTNKISVENFRDIFPQKTTPIPYAEEGLYFEGEERLGRTPLHHAGAFYLQEPSAMIPVAAAQIPSDAVALDLCAAPGGKSIMLAKRLKNGCLVSNEINLSRAKILYSNIERMGLKNVAVTNNAPKDFAKYKQTFDVILVDAPCSGEGMFRKDEDAVRMWSEASVRGCAQRQTEILDSIVDCLKPGGLIIYSTCTFSQEENEGVVTGFLGKYPDFVLEKPTDEVIKITAESKDSPYMRRAYPHTCGGEGQFVALLRKSGERMPSRLIDVKTASAKTVSAFLKSIDLEIKYKMDGDRAETGIPLDLRGLRVVANGVYLGNTEKNFFKPSHHFFTAYGGNMKNKFLLNIGDTEKYLRGEELICDNNNGYCAVICEGLTLGGGKVSEGRLKNLYPKGLRNFK
ncbi:MAG: RsmF rRNA methyltransferase first C-terminal domain-containing protein [Clostridia bacterium]|nr:RsmF rRNA methyltransferase first C-terminal domain-containing protein [Clostridia bacterium]